MSLKKKTILVLVAVNIAILLNVIPVTMVLAPNAKDTIESCHSPTFPVVDGVFSPGEWSVSTPVNVELFNVADQTDSIVVEIRSLYEDENMIHFGVAVEDDTPGGEDYLTLYFHNNPSGPFMNTSGAAPNLLRDCDAKKHWVPNNLTEDLLTTGTGFGVVDDPTAGGTNDAFGKCHRYPTKITFEIQFPLDSGDAAGKDVKLQVNDTIDMITLYHDDTTGKDYSQYLQLDSDYNFNPVKIGCFPTTATNLYLLPIIAGIIASAALGVIIRKRK